MPPPDPQPKFRRRAEARPDEILDAALTLFETQGFAATTVEQIARQAGLSKGAVYLYFPSKDAVLEGLVRRAITPLTDEAARMLRSHSGDPRPVLARLAQVLRAGMADEHTLAIPKLVIREAVGKPELAAMYRDAVIDRVMPALTSLISQGVAGGYIRPVDPELTVRTILGPILMHLLLADVFGVQPEGGLRLDDLIDNHLSILFAGLAPETGDTP